METPHIPQAGRYHRRSRRMHRQEQSFASTPANPIARRTLGRTGEKLSISASAGLW